VGTCLDAKSGETVWQERLGGNFSASPVFAAGRIYFQDEDGQTHVLAAGRTFEKLAENSLPERTLASFAVQEGAIYLRGDKHLYRIGQ
jgi:outer membrane protein assembly factor BamB